MLEFGLCIGVLLLSKYKILGGNILEKSLTLGSVFKNILIFSLPYLFSYLLQTLYGMADLFIIGQFGTVSDTTSVSVGSQVTHMLTVMIVGLAMGQLFLSGRLLVEMILKKPPKVLEIP